ncbi:MAG TPA: hypothetical protein GYA08_17365 [Chloroflexi bacterium]|nr:hypothetical protein [Chloroflexota bacterium]
MLSPNEYVLNETQRLHRQELMSHAAHARLLQQLRPAEPSWLDWGLAWFGRVLVRCGQRLAMRAPIGLNGAQP